MKEKFVIYKEFFSMLKEAIIVLLFLFLILWPAGFKDKLISMGFTQFEAMGMKLNLEEEKKKMQTTMNASTEVANMQMEVNNLKGVIDSIAKKTTNADQKKTLTTLASKTSTIYKAANNIESNLKEQMSVQQNVLTQMKVTTGPSEGWIFAGKLQEDKVTWDDSEKANIKERESTYKPGETLTIINNVYMRSDGSPLVHAKSEVTGLVSAGEQVTYLDQDYSHSVGGGWFLWIKIKRNTKS